MTRVRRWVADIWEKHFDAWERSVYCDPPAYMVGFDFRVIPVEGGWLWSRIYATWDDEGTITETVDYQSAPYSTPEAAMSGADMFIRKEYGIE